jgi:plasmid maintenance system antidote protein VapI
MLPILVQHLPRDRQRMGLSEGHMAWLLGITRRDYRELLAGRLSITNDLYERIVDVCGWPLWPLGSSADT